MSNITNLIGTTWRLGDFTGAEIGAPVAWYITGNINFNGSIGGIELTMVGDFSLISVNGTNSISSITFFGDFNATYNGNPVTLTEITYENGVPFTITGGADISNPLFIDFINTYGTLVSGGEEKPIFTYDLTQLNLAAGTYSITIVAKAVGYNDAPSNTAQFVVEQESFVEETNEYGTTMVINRYTEEPNEYGTTMIIGGEAV